MSDIFNRQPARSFLRERETYVPRKKLVDVIESRSSPLTHYAEAMPLPTGVRPEQAIEVVAGGCLPKNDWILTNPNEFTPIDRLSEGVTVYSVCGEKKDEITKAKATGPWSAGIMPVYRLTTRPDVRGCNSKSYEIEASFNHPFLVKRGYYRWYVPAENLTVGQRMVVLNCLPHGDPYSLPDVLSGYPSRIKLRIPRFTSEKMMWLFGYWIGDGYLKPEEVVFANKKSIVIRNRLIEYGKELFDIKGYSEKDRTRFHSKYLVKLWRSLGLEGHASTKKVPQWVFTVTPQERTQFILGYLAADANKRGENVWRASSINHELLKMIRDLARITGFAAYSICSRDKNTVGKIGDRTIVPTGKENNLTLRYMGPQPLRCDRLTEKELIGNKECFDIQVTGPTKCIHSFIANGFVVHNTWARGIAEGVCGPGYAGFVAGSTEWQACVYNVSHRVAARTLGLSWTPPTTPPSRPRRRGP